MSILKDTKLEMHFFKDGSAKCYSVTPFGEDEKKIEGQTFKCFILLDQELPRKSHLVWRQVDNEEIQDIEHLIKDSQ